jgi:PAS domain S-box-containing protein
LLQDASIQSEELLLKENDMKKSYLEIAAIQEELSRNENEMKQLKETMEAEVIQKTEELTVLKEEVLKEQQKALQKEQQVLAILNGIESAIFLSTEEGEILMANEGTSIMMGYAMKELIGMNINNFLLIEKLSMGKPFRHTMKQKNGTSLPCEIVVNKMGINGVKANMYFVTDISTQLSTENEYAHKIEALETELKTWRTK